MRQWDWEEKIAVIYLGTRKLVALAGDLRAEEPKIMRVVQMSNPPGFRAGFVTSMDAAMASLESIVNELFQRKTSKPVSAYVVLGNAKLKAYGFSSSQYYQAMRRHISSAEIRSVINQTRSVATLPLSEFVLQAVPESFLVNDIDGIRNPLGLEAHRLGVNLRIFTIEFESFRNIANAFESAEIEVRGYFPKSLTASEAILTEQEKEEGVLLLDIADEATQLVLWKNGQLINASAIQIGGRYLTERIAETWGIEFHDAERVKEQFATLEEDPRFEDELVPLVNRHGRADHSVKRGEFQRKFLRHAEAWMSEILAVADRFAETERLLYPHHVFTGGGTSLDGFLEFVSRKFSRDGRMGFSRKIDALSEILVDPSLTAALGMFRWLNGGAKNHEAFYEPQGLLEKTLLSARSWFNAYF